MVALHRRKKCIDHNPSLRFVCLVSIFLSFSLPLRAQRITGTLEGHLTDSLGNPISGVTVIVSGENIPGSLGTATDTLGDFTFFAVPTGVVSAVMRHSAYQSVTIRNILIQLGRTTSLGSVHLHGRLVQFPEIVLEAEKPLIDPVSSASGMSLQSSDFIGLPVERNYQHIATLVPQANLSYFGDGLNIMGGTGRENKYYLDGQDISDSHFGWSETDLPYNFIKDIQVITGGYDAEYRSALGGAVNVATYTGTNEVHGSLVAFYTSDRFSAHPRRGLYDATQGGFSNYDVGGSIGLPLMRDQLWLYCAYSPTYMKRDVDVPGFGTHTDETVSSPFAAKVSWKPDEKWSVTGSATGSPSDRTSSSGENFPSIPVSFANPDPFLRHVRVTGLNLTLNGVFVAKENLMIEASLSRISRNEDNEPQTERGRNELLFANIETGVFSGGSSGSWAFHNTSYEARLAGTTVLGPHTIKSGIVFRDNGTTTDVNVRYLQYPSSYNDTLYFQLANRVLGTVHNRIPSVFIQDSWRMSPHIVFRPGLRWDGQYLIATDGSVGLSITDQIQPRVGLIVFPGSDETQKISASYGRFVQDIHTIVAAGFLSDEGYHYEIEYDRDPRAGGISGDTVVNQPFRIEHELSGLKGQYYDEFMLSYERVITKSVKLTLSGVYRTLREAIDDAFVPDEHRFLVGNPGEGKLSHVPRPQRDYSALAISLEQRDDPTFNFVFSYVLSRAYGNYPGLFDVSFPGFGPNTTTALDSPDPQGLGTGLLPNDRTHVAKLWTSWCLNSRLTIGTSFTWESGTPISAWAGFGTFVSKRGTSGRTPSLWDLNVRATWSIPVESFIEPRIILDILHVASQQKAVHVVQQRYTSFDASGNPSGLNPSYGQAYRYQPPMSVRLGMEVTF